MCTCTPLLYGHEMPSNSTNLIECVPPSGMVAKGDTRTLLIVILRAPHNNVSINQISAYVYM